MIAERAQVSSSTVSRVLNSYEFVDEATRNRVWEIAKELGYPLERFRRVPDETRSILVTGMGELGSPPATPEFVTRVLSGVEAIMSEKGILVRSQTALLQNISAEIRRYIKNNPGLEGFVLLGGNINLDLVTGLRAAKVPFVIAGGHPRMVNVNCVMADYVDGVMQAVRHLTARGRKQIALLNTTNYTVTSYEKYHGYRLALALHDLAFTPDLVVEGQPSAESGYVQMRELLRRRPEVDSVICADDYMAVGALRALQEQKRIVPDDVAVIGIHDYSVAAFTAPPLTTIALDMVEMGRIAARLLWLSVQQELDDELFVLLPTQLVIRTSA
jgi:LacI family transcriptional regulator